MANLPHENKKNAFEALKVLEALESKYSFVAGESVATANVIIFLPKNDDGIDTDEDDGNDLIVFRTTFAEGSFHQMLNRNRRHKTNY